MSKLPAALANLPFPVIASPLFIISNPKLVIEQCKAGVVGSMPALNARPAEQLEEWLIEITETLAAYNKANPNDVYAGSVPYLMLTGNLMAGWQMGRAMLVALKQSALGNDKAFMDAKVITARFSADHLLSRAPGVRDSIVDGAKCVTELSLEAF